VAGELGEKKKKKKFFPNEVRHAGPRIKKEGEKKKKSLVWGEKPEAKKKKGTFFSHLLFHGNRKRKKGKKGLLSKNSRCPFPFRWQGKPEKKKKNPRMPRSKLLGSSFSTGGQRGKEGGRRKDDPSFVEF